MDKEIERPVRIEAVNLSFYFKILHLLIEPTIYFNIDYRQLL